MWGRSTKQRKAAQKRHRKYLKAWDQKMKALAFGWLYSARKGPAPEPIQKWLKRRNNMMLNPTRRRTGAAFSDFAATELRVLAGMAQALNYPIVTAVQNDEYTVTRRRRT